MEPSRPGGISRRRLLASLGAGAAAGAGLVGAGLAVAETRTEQDAGADRVPFDGPHQAGIATAVQATLHFAAFDVTTTDVAALRTLLQDWTEAPRQMCLGRPV